MSSISGVGWEQNADLSTNKPSKSVHSRPLDVYIIPWVWRAWCLLKGHDCLWNLSSALTTVSYIDFIFLALAAVHMYIWSKHYKFFLRDLMKNLILPVQNSRIILVRQVEYFTGLGSLLCLSISYGAWYKSSTNFLIWGKAGLIVWCTMYSLLASTSLAVCFLSEDLCAPPRGTLSRHDRCQAPVLHKSLSPNGFRRLIILLLLVDAVSRSSSWNFLKNGPRGGEVLRVNCNFNCT